MTQSARLRRFSGKISLRDRSFPGHTGYPAPPYRRVDVFLGLGFSESAPNHRALHESLLIADSRQIRDGSDLRDRKLKKGKPK
jgi:hypothetical protein